MTERTVERALADAQAKIRDHDRSGSGLRALTAEAWDEIGDRCIADAVRPDTDVLRYEESITLAALCYANARKAREWRHIKMHKQQETAP